MLGCGQHGARVAALDDLALLHDDEAVADVVGGREVVGDVDDRDPEVVAQRPEQVDDRHPQRGVDHRDRLVGDDQRRLRDQRAGDRDALQLAAGQLVRKAARTSASESPTLRSASSARASTSAVRPRIGEAARRHEEVAVDALQRVEGLERVLEDRLDLAHEGEALARRPRMVERSRAAKADRARASAAPGSGSCARAWSCRCRTRR